MKQTKPISSENVANAHSDVVREVMLDFLDQDNSLSQCCAIQALTKLGATDDETQQHLLAMLKDPDPDVRMQTAFALGELSLGESESTAELKIASAIEALVYTLENDPEGDVRIQAVTALAKFASSKTLAPELLMALLIPLIRCLEQDGYPQLDLNADEMEFSPCWEVQSQALNALGKLGDARAVTPIIKLLQNDEYEHLQQQGFRVLAQIDNTQTLSFLLKQLKQGSPLARRRTAQALSSLTLLHADNKELPLEVLTALSHALGDSDPSVRLYVAKALAQTRNPLVSAPLILLLNDPDPEVRQEVAKLLGKLRGKDIVNHLHTLLSEAKGKQKASIVHVLGEIGDSVSVEILTALLDIDDSDLLYEVVWALGECGLSSPTIHLATILATEKNDPSVRIQAAQSLGKLLYHKKPIVLKSIQEDVANEADVADQNKTLQLSPQDVLIKAIYDKHVGVSYAALNALVDIDPENAQQLLINVLHKTSLITVEDSNKNETDNITSMTLEELKQQKPELVEQFHLDASPENSTLSAILMASPSEQVEAQATQNHKQMHTGIRHSKPSPRERIRLLAARLLGNNNAPNDEVISTLMHCAQNVSTALRCEALRALGRIQSQRALPVIQEALKSEQRDIKLAALEALGQLLSQLPINTKVTVLQDLELAHLHIDPDADIRRSTILVMLAIGLPQTCKHICQALQDEQIEVCRTVLKALTQTNRQPEYSDAITDLMFGFSGELRIEAATTLRRINDLSPAPRLLKMLVDPKFEEYHWICIDALAEMYAVQTEGTHYPGTSYAA